MSIFLVHSGEATSHRVYLDDIGTASISSATIVDVSPLTFGSVTADNTTTPKSVVVPVIVAAASHGKLAQATLTFAISGGGTIPRALTYRVNDSN